MNKPTLHREFKINERVWFDKGDCIMAHGRITGIGFQQAEFMGRAAGVRYFITLDEPLVMEGWNAPWETVMIPGDKLRTRLDVLA